MHDGMQYDPIRSKVKVKVTSPSKLEIRPFSTVISIICMYCTFSLYCSIFSIESGFHNLLLKQ